MTRIFQLTLIFSIAQLIYGRYTQRIPVVEPSYAKQTDSPWTIWMQIGTESRCTGSLVNNKYVITAAHCFDEILPEDRERFFDFVKIFIGDWKTENITDCSEEKDESTSEDDEELCSPHNVAIIPAEKLYIHELYNPKNINNDIAIIELKRPPRQDNFIKNIQLPSHEMCDGDLEGKLHVSGYGQIKDKIFTKIKKFTEINIENDCKRKAGTQFNDHIHFCGTADNGLTSCSGDSGGPATNQVKNVDILQGIVLTGINQCIPSTTTPTTFLKIACFLPWIEEKMYGKNSTSNAGTNEAVADEEETECDDDLC